MTDQPTTWMPERALAMLRDWGSIGCSDFNAKWGCIKTDDLDTIAIAALESAAAEIERQKARADAAEMEVEVLRWFLRGEVKVREDAQADAERLRAALAAKQLAEAEAAQQGPSDEEIAGSIKCVWTWGCKRSAHALQLLARRAGVKL